MKVVAFNGSARRGGNTAILLGYTLGELAKEGIETELVELGGTEIHGCLACRKCSARKNRRCSQENDMGNVCIEKMDAADGILLGSPTYVADVSPEIKALIYRKNKNPFREGNGRTETPLLTMPSVEEVETYRVRNVPENWAATTHLMAGIAVTHVLASNPQKGRPENICLWAAEPKASEPHRFR
jgi:hypothetical protein